MKTFFKTLAPALLIALGLSHSAIAQKQTIVCNTSTGAACNITSNPGDGNQGDPAWLFNGKSNVNFGQIFTMLGPTGTLPAPLYGLQFNNNGTLGSLLPGSTGTWCLDWTNLAAAPTLISCAGGGTVTSIGVTVPSYLTVSPSSITSSGTFAISGTIEPNNEVLASAPNGTNTGLAPRALVAADIPTIPATGLSGTLQAAQEPAHTGDVTNSAGSLAMTVGKVNGLPIPPSAGLVGTNSSNQFVAVTTPLSLSLGGTGTASPGLVAGSNISVTGSWPNQTINASATNSLAFSGLTSATNTQLTGICGTGCSLSATGSGAINATNTVDVNGATVPASAIVLGSNSLGQLLFETTTGTGFPVLSTSPTLVTPTLGAATATSINGTAIPASATLLVNGGALGTPSSATLTHATGLPTTGLTGTLPAAQEPAHTGDMTNTAGSLATTVVAVNGGALPISASVLGTNASGQIVVGSAGGGGTVTTSGTPASGNLTAFSGSTAITNSNLSGDVTTSGTLATTVGKVNGSAIPVSALALGSNSSGQLVSETTTGTGNHVLSTSPTLVTPALGTPSALVLTNATGLPNASVIGLGTFATANAATPPTIGGTTPAGGSFSSLTDTGITGSTQCLHVNTAGLISGTGVDCGSGSGSAAFSSITTGTNTTAGMLVGTGSSLGPTGSGTVTANALSSGIALGTPASGTLTNATGLPLTTGVTGLLQVANGGTGTATPSLVAGTNVTITGTWPNQTVTASATGATAFSALTGATNTTAAMVVGTGASIAPSGSGTITATAMPTTGLSGTLQAAQEPAHTGDVTNTAGSLATTVKGINGTILSSLATGILKNTITTGVPSIAVASDFPTLNQSTTGNAGTATHVAATGLTGNLAIANFGSGTGAASGTYWSGSGTWTPPGADTCVDATGSTTTYVCTSANGQATTAGKAFLFQPMASNTGPSSLTINAVEWNIQKQTQSVVAGDLIGGEWYEVVSDGATWQLISRVGTDGTTNFASGVTGVLPIANGGTNSTTLAGANIPVQSGAITSGHCVEWLNSTTIEDAGAGCGTGGSSAFSALTSSTNTTAAMIMGTGSSLATSGSGTITATAAPFSGISTGTNTAATMTIGTGGTLTISGTGVNNANQVNGAVVPASAALLASNSSSQATAVTLAQTLALNSGALGTVAPNRTVTTSPTVASTDMGGVIYLNVTGGGTVTIPAISSTVFANQMSLTLVNYSASTAAISTTPTVNAGGGCVSGTGIPAGSAWEIVSNGTTLGCNQTISSGGGGGSGTVASSTTGQIPVYTSATTVTGSANATLTSGALTLGVSGTAGSVKMGNATSGTLQLQPVTGALGAVTASLPANTGTIAETNLAQTFSAVQTFSAANAYGTPASITLTNATGLPVGGIAPIAANTVVMNATGSSASPTAVTTVTYLIDAGTTFTLGTGTGACATTSTLTGGTTAGSFLCTGTAGASTQPIVLPTAPHGWACRGSDVTSGVEFAQSATSTTGCTLKGTIATTSDVVVFSAIGY